MLFRDATVDDITEIFVVRYSVKENKLYDSDLVDEQMCRDYLITRGKGWVCEMDNQVVGFAIADLKENNIWALFLKPEYEGKGIGQQLQKIMMNWYFSQTRTTAWLETSPDTRAELFYRKSGWKEVRNHGNGEIKFEMTYEDWMGIKNKI